jgi:hypothetical protein
VSTRVIGARLAIPCCPRCCPRARDIPRLADCPRNGSDQKRRPDGVRRDPHHGLGALAARSRPEARGALRTTRYRCVDPRPHRHGMRNRPEIPTVGARMGGTHAGRPGQLRESVLAACWCSHARGYGSSSVPTPARRSDDDGPGHEAAALTVAPKTLIAVPARSGLNTRVALYVEGAERGTMRSMRRRCLVDSKRRRDRSARFRGRPIRPSGWGTAISAHGDRMLEDTIPTSTRGRI